MSGEWSTGGAPRVWVSGARPDSIISNNTQSRAIVCRGRHTRAIYQPIRARPARRRGPVALAAGLVLQLVRDCRQPHVRAAIVGPCHCRLDNLWPGKRI